MGLIQAAKAAIGSVVADQWREYFYCDSITNDVLVVKGSKRQNGKRQSSNTKAEDNIISNGSIIAVNEGQCMIIVDQGKVVEICAEPGEFVYDTSSEPSLFYGNLGTSIGNSFKTLGKRFTFGGDTAKDQRVYFFNTKEMFGSLFGSQSPIPFRVFDNNLKTEFSITLVCNGTYTFKLVDPILFYTNVCGNVSDPFVYNNKTELYTTMRTEFLSALMPAMGEISDQHIHYTDLMRNTTPLSEAMQKHLSSQWAERRGIQVLTVSFNKLQATEESTKRMQSLEMTALLSRPELAASHLVQAQADAMRDAASNKTAGPMMAFAGMNMATMAGGMNPGNLYGMAQQQQMQQQQYGQPQQPQYGQPQYGQPQQPQYGQPQQPQQPQQSAPMMQAPGAAAGAVAGWTCACGATDNKGVFCVECGAKKPEPSPAADGWTCTCGAINKGKFCMECGSKKPAGAPLYKCDKCGWEPKDPAHPPKFCPECGDIFDENDVQ